MAQRPPGRDSSSRFRLRTGLLGLAIAFVFEGYASAQRVTTLALTRDVAPGMGTPFFSFSGTAELLFTYYDEAPSINAIQDESFRAGTLPALTDGHFHSDGSTLLLAFVGMLLASGERAGAKQEAVHLR